MKLEFYLVIAWLVLVMTWYTIRELRRPRIAKQDIIYQETWQSGCRLTNLWTRLGSARNCLHIMFLSDRLIIRAHYPFGMIAGAYGLDMEIPYHTITTVSIKKVFWTHKFLELHFRSSRGDDAVMFACRDYDKALSVLRDHCDSNTSFTTPA